ncbi:toprim domain-containing protein [Mesorhizobium sp. M0771]|uniref:toprim domain-containing protein n=1 Tax=Mesorhizobium sp. M0771 TaxID=2956997 RepID=UPI00333A3B46
MGELTRTFAPIAREVAISLLGKPDYEGPRELRWGSKIGLSVSISGSRRGRFHDFSTGEHGDLVDLVVRETGWSPADAIHWLLGFGGSNPRLAHSLAAAEANGVAEQQIWSDKAQAVWDRSVPLTGTIGEGYLRKRHCFVQDAAHLRFLAATDAHPPAVVALVTDFLSGARMTLHFLRLDPGTVTKLVEGNMLGHKLDGGVVRLVPGVEVGGSLGVAEGIETALSVIAGGRGPVWATLGKGNMAKLPPVATVGDLNIWADNDKHQLGLKAANALATRWHIAGHVTRINAPRDVGADWNDVIRGLAK